MNIDNNELYKFLRNNGVEYLYHANTVLTSCTFIQNGGLLSRGFVERNGLNQTPQDSDEMDKKFNVWNDIFLDSIDLHTYFPRQNYYGPVLFKFDVSVLNDQNLPYVWITKNNPIYWYDGQNEDDRYFRSIDELNSEFLIERQKKMITLRNALTPLAFSRFLREIIIDDPRVKIGETILFDSAKSSIINALTNAGMNITILHTRQCLPGCYCHNNYLHQLSVDDLKRLFLI